MIPKSPKTVYLAPVRANIGVEREYQRRIDALIEEMNRSLVYWISAAYRANEPEILGLASDAMAWDDLLVTSVEAETVVKIGQYRPLDELTKGVSLSCENDLESADADFFRYDDHQIDSRQRRHPHIERRPRHLIGGLGDTAIGGAAHDAAPFVFDASPARSLIAVVKRLTASWQTQFDELAPRLATWFATAQEKRSAESLKASLRKGGFSVKFKPTRAQNDSYQSVIGENVGLIRSIPAQHLTQVEGMVMRAVQQGRNLGPLVQDLEHQFAVTRRRASFIARDQANKATAVFTRVKHQELGIEEARWQHSHGGKVPRPTHVKASKDRVLYKVSEGWYDSDVGKYVWPGELSNCRCVAIPVIPGFS